MKFVEILEQRALNMVQSIKDVAEVGESSVDTFKVINRQMKENLRMLDVTILNTTKPSNKRTSNNDLYYIKVVTELYESLSELVYELDKIQSKTDIEIESLIYSIFLHAGNLTESGEELKEVIDNTLTSLYKLTKQEVLN